jgi:hypothetical protein
MNKASLAIALLEQNLDIWKIGSHGEDEEKLYYVRHATRDDLLGRGKTLSKALSEAYKTCMDNPELFLR